MDSGFFPTNSIVICALRSQSDINFKILYSELSQVLCHRWSSNWGQKLWWVEAGWNYLSPLGGGMTMQWWWSVGWEGVGDEKRETDPSAKLFTTNLTQDAIGLNLNLHSEEPVSSQSYLWHRQSNQYILDSIPCIPILTSYFPRVLLKIMSNVSLWKKVSPVKLCMFHLVVIHIVCIAHCKIFLNSTS